MLQKKQSNHQARTLTSFTVGILALLVGLTLGVGLGKLALPAGPAGTAGGVAASAAPTTTSTVPRVDLGLLNQAQNFVDQNYVDRSALQPLTLTYGAISGMVEALGDTGHSRFLSPDDVKAEQSLTTGQYQGVGLEVETKDGNVVVVAPLDGSPAQKAGIRSGDIIAQVNGKSVQGLSLQNVVSQVLGPAGTSLHLTVLRPSTGQTLDFTLTRAKLALQSVTWQRLPGTSLADLRISEFSDGEARDLGQALRDIQAQHLTGIVLDLRDDPGGLLSEAVVSASYFLTSGNVLLEKDAQGKITPVPVQPQSEAVNLPVVALVNEGTASSAEILAGALQDAHRAQLLGAATFGTGTVLNEFPLSDGSALLLATQEWLTPGGRVIWHVGIQPDQPVALSPNTTPLVPEEEQAMSAAQVQSSGDTQLLDAITRLTTAGK
jgi:carboxyl-terminal processing protease